MLKSNLQLAKKHDFLAVARIISRNLNFFGGGVEEGRIAVPAVMANRARSASSAEPSRLLKFRNGDEISGRRSGTLRARSGAGCSSYAAIAVSPPVGIPPWR